MSQLLRTALQLANLGFPVFPCFEIITAQEKRCGCGDAMCRSPGKHPALHNGFKGASRDPRQIRIWWAERPWNIGVATGSPAVVLDVDLPDGPESLARLEIVNGALPRTWRSITGSGGQHIFFAPPPGKKISNSARKIGAGLDIRGTGGYVIAPPSLHVSGTLYAWDVGGSIFNTDLAPMPDWLAAASEHNSSGAASTLASLTRDVGEGSRNVTLAKLAGHLLRRYVEPMMVLDLVCAYNAYHCTPALEMDEVEKIVDSISSCELRRRWARE